MLAVKGPRDGRAVRGRGRSGDVRVVRGEVRRWTNYGNIGPDDPSPHPHRNTRSDIRQNV